MHTHTRSWALRKARAQVVSKMGASLGLFKQRFLLLLAVPSSPYSSTLCTVVALATPQKPLLPIPGPSSMGRLLQLVTPVLTPSCPCGRSCSSLCPILTSLPTFFLFLRLLHISPLCLQPFTKVLPLALSSAHTFGFGDLTPSPGPVGFARSSLIPLMAMVS